MRIKERISNFIEKVDVGMIEDFPLEDYQIEEINKNLDNIKTSWEKNPDLRFAQILIYLGYMGNVPGFYFYKEEDDILLEQGLPPREVLFWGQNYDKDMNRLPKTKWVLIKDLTTDHIEAILEGNYTQSPRYINAFTEELKLRKNG